MVTTTQRRRALDDDDVFDSDLYDPKYFPRQVVRDGKGIRTPLFLSDGRPDWMPPTRPALFDYARDAYRNYYYQPHFFVGHSADPLAAARSYLDAAYRTMPSGAAKTTAPAADEPDGDDDTMTPRDRYIKRLQTAYRTPGSPDDSDSDNPVEAQRMRWLSPGASPGPGPGYGDARPRPTTDAAAGDDRDQAYAEYVARISDGWRR